MCGVFGAIGNNGRKEIGQRVCDILHHRGPDDRGLVEFPGGLLTHTRLSIIDLSNAGHQPMLSNDGNLSIVFNGEIYNYRELKEELKNSYTFKTNTDTEVILAAYQKWGESCLQRLRGMFAFGLWDAKKKQLFAAVDRFSIKPLYYYQDKDNLLFSSEIKAILAAGVKALPNKTAMYDFLAFGFLDHTKETFFQNIYQLRPAHHLIFREGQLKIKKYWDIEERPCAQKEENQVIEEVSQKLEEVIKYHLISDVEVALSLSSGLDSNFLRGAVPKISKGGQLQCFNYAFVGTPYDESRYLRSLAPDSTFCATEITPKDFFQNYSELIRVMEQPATGLGMYGYWLNAKTVRDKGIKVLLDGQGGDEAFGGYKHYYYHRFAELYHQNKFGELGKEIALFNNINGDSIKLDKEFGAFIQKKTDMSSMKAADGTSMESAFMAQDFAKEFAGRTIAPERKFKESLRDTIYNDLFSFKIPKLLRFQDKTAMAWSVESRVPFLDHTLIELMFSLPSRYLLREGINKHLFRMIAQKYLGNSMLKIPKLYMNTPQREWIKRDLSDEIKGMMADSLLVKDGYINGPELRREFDDYLQQKDLGNSFFAWKFFSLELWYRNFIKNL